ncbi:hypothetical protein NSP_35780 [Nodularia spumigena CCY9414]|nr:hypothetical protein NSP_35780 [Nodularia spumigena CCY9414]
MGIENGARFQRPRRGSQKSKVLNPLATNETNTFFWSG